MIELGKSKSNTETRIGMFEELKCKLQKIIINNKHQLESRDTFTKQLDKDVSKFDVLVEGLEKAIQPLANSEETKTRYRDDQGQEEEFQRFEQKKKLEETRMEMSKQYKKKVSRRQKSQQQ